MIEIVPVSPSADTRPPAPPAPAKAAGTSRASISFARVLEGERPGVPPAAVGLGQRFEAAVLTPLLAAILPPEDSTVWGGSAGKMWRGLFAEELAAATSRSGGIGIAELIDEAVVSKYLPAQGDEG